MFKNVYTRMLAICSLVGVLLLATLAVFAGDNRINLPSFHFGGDTLFCNREEGCNLLNLNGTLLKNWPAADISAALDSMDANSKNTLVGDGAGTYGAVSLWAVVSNLENGNKTLCFLGYDEWSKQHNMCFEVTKDFVYQQVGLPAVSQEEQAAELTLVPTFTATPNCIPPLNAENLDDTFC